MNILITGASGNVGRETVKALVGKNDPDLQVFVGLRHPQADAGLFSGMPVKKVAFDFLDLDTFEPALAGIEVVFLLRPPQLSDAKGIFGPFIEQARHLGVRHVAFLSVQGADTSTMIPHHKIEKLLEASGIAYTFLRPAYFMQNFTTTLLPDIRTRRRIYLPAGEAKFSLIDLCDVGRVAAEVLAKPKNHINKSYDLTNGELMTFREMAGQLSETIGKTIKFESPGPVRFLWHKIREGTPTMLALVMIMLHYLPRFSKPPMLSDWVAQITGRVPITFAEFAEREKETFM
jgi:uncharacterized protein YbjT (DUF2867 family)